MEPVKNKRHEQLLMALCLSLIIISVFCLYLRTWSFGFINLDDHEYVSQNPILANGFSFKAILQAFSSFSYCAIWMPLTWISYMIDMSLWGKNPHAMHVVNTVFHFLNTVLVFALCRFLLLRTASSNLAQPQAQKTSGAYLGMFIASFLSALFWAMHPLRVEPTAWIASRKDVLSLFWELCALLFWLKDAEGEQQQKPSETCKRFPWTVPVLAWTCYVCACLSKPTAMTFPILAGLLEYLAFSKVSWKKLFAPTSLALGCAAIASYSQSTSGATNYLHGVPLSGRLMNAVSAIGLYCWNTVWPEGLAVPYAHRWPDPPTFFLPALIICIGYGLVWCWSCREVIAFACRSGIAWIHGGARTRSAFIPNRKHPARDAIFVGLSWFIVSAGPMLGLLGFGYHSHADRFTYLPAVGFSIILAFFFRSVLQRVRPAFALSLSVAMLSLVTIYGMRTKQQIAYWENDKTLFLHTLSVEGDRNFLANRALGTYYYGIEHDLPRANACLKAALRVNADENRCIQLLLIYGLAEEGRLTEAKAELADFSQWIEKRTPLTKKQMALERMGPTIGLVVDTFLAHAGIAVFENDDDLAEQHAVTALGRAPENGFAHYVLGLIAQKKGLSKETLNHWHHCLRGPDWYVFYFLRRDLLKLETL